MAYVNKCNWCNDQYQEGVYSSDLGRSFCCNRCKNAAENAQKDQEKPKEKVQVVEKTIYVDKTSEAEKDQMRASAELLRQRARQLKREQDKIDADEYDVQMRSNKKWILLGLVILGVVLNVATFGDTAPWICSNAFILFYVIYFFFGKKIKKIGKWFDDKLN